MNDILQTLVILQDLDDMIGEAENTELLKEQEEMGFEMKGLQKLKAKMGPIREKLDAARKELAELEAEFKKKELVWSDDVKKTKIQAHQVNGMVKRFGISVNLI